MLDIPGLLPPVVVTAVNVDDDSPARKSFAVTPGRDYARLRVVWGGGKYYTYGQYDGVARHRRRCRVSVVSLPAGEQG